MNWIDDITALLKDGSILNFNVDGSVEMFPSKLWRKKTKGIYKYESKEIAIQIWSIIDSHLESSENTE